MADETLRSGMDAARVDLTSRSMSTEATEDNVIHRLRSLIANLRTVEAELVDADSAAIEAREADANACAAMAAARRSAADAKEARIDAQELVRGLEDYRAILIDEIVYAADLMSASDEKSPRHIA